MSSSLGPPEAAPRRDRLAQPAGVGLLLAQHPQALEARVDRLAAHLGRAVGHEHDAAARLDPDLALAEGGGLERADGRVALDVEQPRGAVGADHDRGQVPGADDHELLGLGVEHDVGERGQPDRAHAREHPVEQVHHVGRRVALERVGAQRGPHLRHQGAGLHAAADHVADHERDLAARRARRRRTSRRRRGRRPPPGDRTRSARGPGSRAGPPAASRAGGSPRHCAGRAAARARSRSRRGRRRTGAGRAPARRSAWARACRRAGRRSPAPRPAAARPAASGCPSRAGSG